MARDFVQSFLKQNNYPPRWGAHIAYLQTMLWAVAVERANTFQPEELIKSLEASKSHPYAASLGNVWYRAEDHQLIRPVPVVIGKPKSKMRNPDDFYEVVKVVPGEDVMQPIAETGCHMPAYS